jgi:hypothetical protein
MSFIQYPMWVYHPDRDPVVIQSGFEEYEQDGWFASLSKAMEKRTTMALASPPPHPPAPDPAPGVPGQPEEPGNPADPNRPFARGKKQKDNA